MQKIEDVILFQIDLTSKVSKQYSQKEFDRLNLGITIEQWVILKIVSESETLSQRDLAKKSYRDPASITRTLDLLEKKGMLTRAPIENNRRAYHIFLTKNGEKFVADNLDLVLSLRRKSTQGISKKELENLSATLSKIQDNFK